MIMASVPKPMPARIAIAPFQNCEASKDIALVTLTIGTTLKAAAVNRNEWRQGRAIRNPNGTRTSLRARHRPGKVVAFGRIPTTSRAAAAALIAVPRRKVIDAE